MELPETQYAKSGDLHIAYQTLGEGPLDLVFIAGFAWHVEYQWEIPECAAMLRRFAAIGRLICFDKRGTGLSDRVATNELPTLEERMDDLTAVLDAAGSRRAALLGFWEGGPMAILFAATFPDRTAALVLYGPPVTFRSDDDYPWRPGPDQSEESIRRLGERWGRETLLSWLAPNVAADARVHKLFAKLERNAASPGAAMALARMNREIDVRHVLPAISVPTLVLHRRDDAHISVEAGRYVAARIPGARFAELQGADHLPFFGDSEAVVGEIEEFLTGVRGSPEVDRVLATILFADVVGSTEHARRLGDRRWRDLLEEFQTRVRVEIERYRGHLGDFAGDGVFATFDGPARAIRSATAIRESLAALGVEVRSGLHTGECERSGATLAGIAVHIAARVAAEAQAGEVLVSRTVRDLVAGSGLLFEQRGTRALKGVPGEWELFAVRE
jgi:class 3 adenylate cyclase